MELKIGDLVYHGNIGSVTPSARWIGLIWEIVRRDIDGTLYRIFYVDTCNSDIGFLQHKIYDYYTSPEARRLPPVGWKPVFEP